jgi:hypothetical protein
MSAKTKTFLSLNQEFFVFDSLEEAIKDIITENTLSEALGRIVYSQEFREYDPAEAFAGLLDYANEQADDDAGYDDADYLFDTSGAAADELREFVSSWARKHANAVRYVPIGKSTAVEITAEHLSEYADEGGEE